MSWLKVKAPRVYIRVSKLETTCAVEYISKIGTSPIGIALDRHRGLYRVSRLAKLIIPARLARATTANCHSVARKSFSMIWRTRGVAMSTNTLSGGCFVQLWGKLDTTELSFSVHAPFFMLYGGGIAGIFGTAVIHSEYSRRPSSLVISGLISQKITALHEIKTKKYKIETHEKLSDI